MFRKAWVCASLVAVLLAGCGQETSPVERGMDSEVPGLAPGSTSGLDSKQVDRGTTATPSATK